MTINYLDDYPIMTENFSQEGAILRSCNFFSETSNYINRNIIELNLDELKYFKEETEKKEKGWFAKVIDAICGFFKWIWKQVVKFVTWLLGLKDVFVYKVRALRRKYEQVKDNIETDFKNWTETHKKEDTKAVVDFFNLSKESDSNEFTTILQDRINNNQKVLNSIEPLLKCKWANNSKISLSNKIRKIQDEANTIKSLQGAERNSTTMGKLFDYVLKHLKKVIDVLVDSNVDKYYLEINNYINCVFYDILSLSSIMLGTVDSLGDDLIQKITKNENLTANEQMVVNDRFKLIADSLTIEKKTDQQIESSIDNALALFIKKFLFWNFVEEVTISDSSKDQMKLVTLEHIDKKMKSFDRIRTYSKDFNELFNHRKTELEKQKQDGLSQRQLKDNLKVFKEDSDKIEKRVSEIKFDKLVEIAEPKAKSDLNSGFTRLQNLTVLLMNMYNIMVTNYNFNIQLDKNICYIANKRTSEGGEK